MAGAEVADESPPPSDDTCFCPSIEPALVNIGDDREAPNVVFRLLIPRPAELWAAVELLVDNEDVKLLVADGVLDI